METSKIEALEAWLEVNNIEPPINPSFLEVYSDPTGRAVVVNKTVNVIDSLMGSGKTTFILNKLNADSQVGAFGAIPPKYLVVVPLLEEVKRFKTLCPQLKFKEPLAIHGRKLLHLDKLIEAGDNIVTTHCLFSMLNRDIYRNLQRQGYTLIIDEAIDCVEMFDNLKKKDLELLFASKMVIVEETTSKLRWNHELHGDYSGKFDDFKKLCDIGSIVWFRNTALIWEFPSEFLTCFKEVYVLTYLFGGSPFCSYLKAEGFNIGMSTIENGKLYDWKTEGKSLDTTRKAALKGLIKLYEGPLNAIGEGRSGKDNPLSSSWFKRKAREEPKVLEKLKANLYNWFLHTAKTPSRDNGWTSYGQVKKHLTGNGYSRGWIANNTRATNDYCDKRSMAYCCNWFHSPVVRDYFQSRGVEVDDELYALSSMIQWVWRSAIRKEPPQAINLYIPSERMRGLFRDWLEG